MKVPSQLVILLLIGISGCSFNTATDTGESHRLLSLARTYQPKPKTNISVNEKKSTQDKIGKKQNKGDNKYIVKATVTEDTECNAAWPMDGYFSISNFNDEPQYMDRDEKFSKLVMKPLGRSKITFSQHFMASYNSEHKAWVIHAREKKNKVWTSSKDFTNSAHNYQLPYQNITLEDYVPNNKKQLWRRTKVDGDVSEQPFYIYNLQGNVNPCQKSTKFNHADLFVLDYNTCSANKAPYGTKFKKTKKQRWFLHIAPYCIPYVECCPNGDALPCDDKRDLIVIGHKDSEGAESALTYGSSAPSEAQPATYVKQNLKDKRQWWFREVQDEGGFVYHLYNSPDMVLSYYRRNESGTVVDRFLTVEKYIPGDHRQLWLEDIEDKDSKNIKTLNRFFNKTKTRLVLTKAGAKAVYKVTLTDIINPNNEAQGWFATEVGQRHKIPEGQDFAIGLKSESPKGKKTVLKGRNVFTINKLNEISLGVYKSGDTNQTLHAFEINSGWVLKSADGKKALAYVEKGVNMVDYLTADPSQVWKVDSKGNVCLRDPFFNTTRTTYDDYCLDIKDKKKLAVTRRMNLSSSSMEFEFIEIQKRNGFPTNYHFTPRNMLADNFVINPNIMIGDPSIVSSELTQKEYKLEDLRKTEFFAVNTNQHGQYKIHSAYDPNLVWTVQDDDKTSGTTKTRSVILQENTLNAKNEETPNVNQLFRYTRAGIISWQLDDKSSRYRLEINKKSAYVDGSAIKLSNSTIKGKHQQWNLKRTGSLQKGSRDQNCPLCGVYTLEDWRDSTFGFSHEYPRTYLRISEPEAQISINWNKNLKWCDFKKQITTHPCEEFYHFPDFTKNEVKIMQKDVKYVSTHEDYIVPSWTIFKKIDDDRVSQAYAWDSPTFRTPNVGVVWRRINARDANNFA